MTETINAGKWKPGQSGNPKGRAPSSRAISEILRLKGEETIVIGGQALSSQEALADAIWRFVLKGEVVLGQKHLQADSVNDWVQAVKWLYTYVDPPKNKSVEQEPEVVVRVVRVNEPRIHHRETEDTEKYRAEIKQRHPLPQPLSAAQRGEQDGETPSVADATPPPQAMEETKQIHQGIFTTEAQSENPHPLALNKDRKRL